MGERFGELAGFYLLAFIAVVLIADSFVSQGIFIVPAVFMTLIAAAYGLGLKARSDDEGQSAGSPDGLPNAGHDLAGGNND
jgi:hypothetical protein